MRVKDARQTFVGVWIRQLLEGNPIEVWGGRQLRDFTDVEDAVDAFLLAAAEPSTDGEAYNLGGAEVIDLGGLAKMLIEVNGSGSYSVREFPAERHAIDIGDYYSDYGKVQAQLGWRPQRTLRDTLERTVSFYREHLARYL
jgi:nucleoside-diphosphate-sugar epimerase